MIVLEKQHQVLTTLFCQMEVPIPLLLHTTWRLQAEPSVSVSKAGNSQQDNPSPIKSKNKPKDHYSKNLALRPQTDENLSDYKDSEAPPVDDDIVAGSKTESSPMDTIKLQRLLNEQSFIREKSSASNAGLRTLKDSSLP